MSRLPTAVLCAVLSVRYTDSQLTAPEAAPSGQVCAEAVRSHIASRRQ